MKTRIRYTVKDNILFSNKEYLLNHSILRVFINLSKLEYSIVDITDQAIVYKQKCKSIRQCKKCAKDMLIKLGVPFTSEFRRR